MATITYDAEGPGKAAKRPVLIESPRVMKIITGKFSFDSSYPTGGEDVSDIFNSFVQLLGLRMDDPTLSAGTGKKVVIDHTAKKAMLATNASPPVEVANTSDQSGAANLRFFAWGY